MMFSASYVNAWYTKDDAYYYFKRQLVFALLGVVVMFVVSHINYEVFEDMAFLALCISVVLLLYVLVNPYIIPGKEEFKRWIKVPFIGTMQPSEIAKIALILFLSWSYNKNRKYLESKLFASVSYFAMIGVLCVLVYLENHLSGTLIILIIGCVMTFFGGTRKEVFVILLVGAAFFLAIAAGTGLLKNYAAQRIDIWLKLLRNEELTDAERQGQGWQILQSLYAIGSGGPFGMGFGNSKQKHLYLPEPQNDFIFAIVCEELGLVRAVIIMILFLLLALRGFLIALKSKNRFASLLALGISFQVALEAGLNIAVVTGTVPNTGIALPFFSYGGSAILTLMGEMGMVLSVSRSIDKTPKEKKINE